MLSPGVSWELSPNVKQSPPHAAVFPRRWCPGDTGCELPGASPGGSLGMALIPPATGCEPEAHQELSTQSLYWRLVMLTPLPDTHQNSRLPEGKQIFRRLRHRVTAISSGNGGKCPKSQVPRHQPGASLASGPF